MSIAFILNPSGKRRRKATVGLGSLWRGGGAIPRRANPIGYPTTARGVAWRKLVQKYGVIEASKRWSKRKGKPKRASAKKKRGGKKVMARKTKRRRKRNPKGYPKTARGRAWRRLVKKHGVKKAAAIKRRRKRGRRRTRTNIATNPRRRARRRTTTARRRSRTRRRRTYRRNPTVVGTAKSLATGVLKKGFLMDVAAGFGGMFGALLGEGIAGKIKGEGKVLNANEKLLGNVGGSVLVGTLVAVVGKDMRRGAIAASTGVAYGLFKRFYGDIREALGGKLVGLDLPAMGDYVELPAGTAGMGSYVEFPAHAGVGQFLPPAEMDPGAGQFIPSEEIETSI